MELHARFPDVGVTDHEAGHRGARRPHGEREPNLGLHAHPRWAQACLHEVARNTIKAILKDRLLHGRDVVAATPLHPLLHRSSITTTVTGPIVRYRYATGAATTSSHGTATPSCSHSVP